VLYTVFRKKHPLTFSFISPTKIFDHLFIKSNISAMDRLIVVKFHTNIANRWLFMTQRKIMAIILYS